MHSEAFRQPALQKLHLRNYGRLRLYDIRGASWVRKQLLPPMQTVGRFA